jgi:hypothetical protein
MMFENYLFYVRAYASLPLQNTNHAQKKKKTELPAAANSHHFPNSPIFQHQKKPMGTWREGSALIYSSGRYNTKNAP